MGEDPEVAVLRDVKKALEGKYGGDIRVAAEPGDRALRVYGMKPNRPPLALVIASNRGSFHVEFCPPGHWSISPSVPGDAPDVVARLTAAASRFIDPVLT